MTIFFRMMKKHQTRIDVSRAFGRTIDVCRKRKQWRGWLKNIDKMGKYKDKSLQELNNLFFELGNKHLVTSQLFLYRRIDTMGAFLAILYRRIDTIDVFLAILCRRIDTMGAFLAILYRRIDTMGVFLATLCRRIDAMGVFLATLYRRIDTMGVFLAILCRRIDTMGVSQCKLLCKIQYH